MPHDAILEKLEETDPRYIAPVAGYGTFYGPEEQLEAAMRAEIIDREPDRPWLESDAPRRNPNASIVALNVRYANGRGAHNDPRHSELFYGFTGNDPRGASTDPRFDKARAHTAARFRGLEGRMGDNVGHGGGPGGGHIVSDRPWAPGRRSYDMKEAHRRQRSQLRVFDTTRAQTSTGLYVSAPNPQHEGLIRRHIRASNPSTDGSIGYYRAVGAGGGVSASRRGGSTAGAIAYAEAVGRHRAAPADAAWNAAANSADPRRRLGLVEGLDNGLRRAGGGSANTAWDASGVGRGPNGAARVAAAANTAEARAGRRQALAESGAGVLYGDATVSAAERQRRNATSDDYRRNRGSTAATHATAAQVALSDAGAVRSVGSNRYATNDDYRQNRGYASAAHSTATNAVLADEGGRRAIGSRRYATSDDRRGGRDYAATAHSAAANSAIAADSANRGVRKGVAPTGDDRRAAHAKSAGTQGLRAGRQTAQSGKTVAHRREGGGDEARYIAEDMDHSSSMAGGSGGNGVAVAADPRAVARNAVGDFGRFESDPTESVAAGTRGRRPGSVASSRTAAIRNTFGLNGDDGGYGDTFQSGGLLGF